MDERAKYSLRSTFRHEEKKTPDRALIRPSTSYKCTDGVTAENIDEYTQQIYQMPDDCRCKKNCITEMIYFDVIGDECNKILLPHIVWKRPSTGVHYVFMYSI